MCRRKWVKAHKHSLHLADCLQLFVPFQDKGKDVIDSLLISLCCSAPGIMWYAQHSKHWTSLRIIGFFPSLDAPVLSKWFQSLCLVDNLPSRYLDFVAQSYAFDSVQRRERKQRNKVTSQVLLWIDVVATELFILSQLCLRVHKRTAVESIAVSMVRSLFFLSKTAHKKYVVTGFDSRWRLGIFLCDTMSRPAQGPKQPPIQWVLGALCLGV
jgi:hypothetical protein